MVGYEVVSAASGESPTGSPSFVSADVSMANVQVEGDYTVPVTFTVTSLQKSGNEDCHVSQMSQSQFDMKQRCSFLYSCIGELLRNDDCLK